MIANDNYNIMLTESSNNTISQNYIGSIEWEGGIRLVYSGIELYRSSNNTIIQNNVTQCQHAIRMEGVIQPGELQSDSSNNTIIENNIENWGSGISFSHSSNNTILKNNITYSGSARA
jgi:parallel beta-helix repeat protein